MRACVCLCVCACVMVMISCRVKESRGWELMFTTPYLDKPPQKIAVNAKVIGNGLGDKMLAYSIGRYIYCTISECYIRVCYVLIDPTAFLWLK